MVGVVEALGGTPPALPLPGGAATQATGGADAEADAGAAFEADVLAR